MRAYKGFNRNEDGTLSCQGFVYEPGKTYKHEGKIELCESGFHACHELCQTWYFYPNNGKTAYYEVECGGDIIESGDNTGKFVCSEITLVKEIDMTYVARFDDVWRFLEGFAMVRLNGKWNFINTEGKLLSEQWFGDVWNFSEGFARIEVDGKCNFVNTEGKIQSEQWFDDAYSFSEGLAAIKIDGKWNFINTEGKLMSGQWYDYVGDFSGGFAKVEIDGKLGKINTKGEFIKK